MGRLGESIYYQSMAFFLDAVRVNAIIKTIEMESHFHVGVSNGLSSPTGHWCSTLTL